MPRMNGLEFLEAVKDDQTLCRIPVVVLTTSTKTCDIDGTFSHSVAGYMVKPIDYEKLVQIIQTLSDYWAINVLPARSENRVQSDHGMPKTFDVDRAFSAC